MLGPMIVIGTLGMGGTILAEAALSFLGLGIRPPYPSWGSMLSEARDQITTAPWLSVFPGLAIFLTVLGLNLLGDGLRDILDPQSRSRAPMTLLAVEDLRIDLAAGDDRHAAVDKVSFEIARGETFGLVGESGCGKIITALAMMGLLRRPLAIGGGSIRFDGRAIQSLDADEMRRLRGKRLAMIFQEPMTALNPLLPVGRQIAEMFILHEGASWRDAERRAVEVLARVRVPAPERRARDYPHQLSGGMRQRVMIAIALACSPDLLIADEPTTALDVTVQSRDRRPDARALRRERHRDPDDQPRSRPGRRACAAGRR